MLIAHTLWDLVVLIAARIDDPIDDQIIRLARARRQGRLTV